jgi:uncharacterized protein (TIGR02284 family)
MKDKAVHVLNDLLEVSRDGEQGFERAAEEVDDPSVKAILADCAISCRTGAQELESEVRRLGGKPDKGGTAKGAVHRGWVKAKAAMSRNDTKVVLNECERGEDYAKGRYAAALDEDDLPSEVRTLIEHQYHGVLANHDRIKTLRDQYAAR